MERVITSRQSSKEKEYLVKWRGIAEPLWQPESNNSLKPYYDHYNQIANCTFDYFPSVFDKRLAPCSVQLENNELVIAIRGKTVTDLRKLSLLEKAAILDRLESLCLENYKTEH